MHVYHEPGYSLPAGSQWKVYHGMAFFLKLVKASAARRRVRGTLYHGREGSGTRLPGVLAACQRACTVIIAIIGLVSQMVST